MPFVKPTLEELCNRAARAFRANLKGSDAKLWPNNVAVSSKVIGGAVHEVLSFIDYIAEQSIKHLAEGQWLERHAYDYGLQKKPASKAQGRIVLSGDVGVVVPAGLGVQRTDGVRYTTTTGGITDGSGNVTVAVNADAAGRSGNADAGAAVTLVAPLARIRSNGLVHSDGIGMGDDVESDDSLRQRLLFRLRNPPHGGAAHDYVAWAREVPGVSRVFVDPVTAINGRTSVGVYFLMDGIYANGIPQGSDVAAVAAYIDALRPAGAIVAVAAPTADTIDIEIDGLTPDTTAIRNAIRSELIELFARCRVSTLTEPATLFRSKIIEAISIATGEEHHTLTLPASDLAVAAGHVPTLGEITYT